MKIFGHSMTNAIIHCSNCGDLGHEQRETCLVCRSESILFIMKSCAPIASFEAMEFVERYTKAVQSGCEILAKKPNYKLAKAMEDALSVGKTYSEKFFRGNVDDHEPEIRQMFKNCFKMLQSLP